MLEAYSYAFPIYQGILALFVILNLSLATFMDPGIYPKGEAVNNTTLANTWCCVIILTGSGTVVDKVIKCINYYY